MKLSSVMFTASLITMALSALILFGVSPEQEFWGQAVFTGFFSSVVYMIFSSIFDANGH
jgi:hypothetical protein